MALHGNVGIEMVQGTVRLLATIPAALVHSLNLLITPARPLVLLRTWDGHERVHLLPPYCQQKISYFMKLYKKTRKEDRKRSGGVRVVRSSLGSRIGMEKIGNLPDLAPGGRTLACEGTHDGVASADPDAHSWPSQGAAGHIGHPGSADSCAPYLAVGDKSTGYDRNSSGWEPRWRDLWAYRCQI